MISNLEKKIKKLNYKKYFKENNLIKLLDTNKYKKNNFSPKFIFENNNKDPYPPDVNDLIRLHYVVRERKILNVLEFGVGYSSLFIADALRLNKIQYNSFVEKNFRKINPFQLCSVDSNNKYIKLFGKKIPHYLKEFINLSYSKSIMTTYNDQICGKFLELPNICPEMIYVDGPSFLDISGDIGGIHFRHMERTIINCDVLMLENLLLPGTLVIWDGQTNNARFNFCNFKRNWLTKTLSKEDISFAEQIEQPLGILNKKQIEFINN